MNSSLSPDSEYKINSSDRSFCRSAWFGVILFIFLVFGYFKVYSQIDYVSLLSFRSDKYENKYENKYKKHIKQHKNIHGIICDATWKILDRQWSITITNSKLAYCFIQIKENNYYHKKRIIESYDSIECKIKDQSTIFISDKYGQELGRVILD